MKITIISEGKTELAFKECLHDFLRPLLGQKMPSLKFDIHHGAIPTGSKLQKSVQILLTNGNRPSDAVIGLTDVYPEFADAAEAKQLMRQWVGPETRFYRHVAFHDFEAWLLPY